MRERARDLILLGAVAVLAVLAAWGWMRRPPETQAASTNCGQAQSAAYGQSGAPQDQPLSGAYSYVNSAAQPSTDLPAYASRGYVRMVRPAPPLPADAEPAAQPPVTGEPAAEPDARPAAPAYAPRPPVAQHFVQGGRAPVHYYTARSHKKSAMIVGGGAGAGAAVGAIAGGGKGAGIGGLVGGVGGFIYDRLTHRHRVH